MQLNPQQIQQQSVVAATIRNLLQGVNGTTFAQLHYTTEVKTAAAHKHRSIVKHTAANVQLFSNVAAATSVFANAVKRSAAQLPSNSPAAVATFSAQSNYFEHDPLCYSIVQHKVHSNLYLYCIYNNASSFYTIDGVTATKQQVAELLTPSAAQQLLNPPATVRNVTHNIEHDVIVRTIALHNINSISAQRSQVQF